jgi:ABC-type multidrug transport system ATPase subunit
MIRQKKSLILFAILSVILLIVPPIVINLVNPIVNPTSLLPPSALPPAYSFGSLEDENSNYDRWLSGDFDFWSVFDETNGMFGEKSKEKNDQNNHIYGPALMDQLAQNLRRYTYYNSWQQCEQPLYEYYERYSTMWMKKVGSIKGITREVAKYYDSYNYCPDSTSSYGLHVRSVSASDASKRYSLDATAYYTQWTFNYEIPVILRAAFLGKAMNYQYSFYDLWNTTNQKMTPLTAGLRYAHIPDNASVPKPKDGFALTFYWIFSMLVLSFLTPMFTQRLVLERADGLVDIATMMGLSRMAHWMGHLVLDFTIYLIMLILILIVAAASSLKVVMAMLSPWVIFSCIIYGFTVIFSAYLLSFAFRSPRTCLIVSYIYSLVLFAIVSVYNMLLIEPTKDLPGYLIWWPALNFFRLTYVGLMRAAIPAASSAGTLNYVLRDSMLALVFETVAIVILVFLLDRFAPTKLGNRGTTLNLITDFFTNLVAKCRRRNKGDYSLLGEDAEPLLTTGEDARVIEEKNAVRNGAIENPIMLVRDITKVYAEGTKRFTALGGISFGLREGDCFGLLGPNGAGKSTLVAIMSGILAPTSGTVTVSKSRDRCAIGLCPQDDIFYADLTVEEHLLYYSRLKGKGPGADQVAVDAILADVSMANERRLYAASLSGGQKRRLSVASALCGDPMVVFLDEPSSSLDPGSRIGLWEIIQSISQNRCTLLTTHSMEEAEVLCTRIGIIKDGSMVCLGTSSQLKNSYGQGYKLLVSIAPGKPIEPVLDAVKKVAPSAHVLTQKHGHYQVGLGVEATLSKVSEVMEANRKPLHIARWSLSRNGLDEVFLKIVEDRGNTNGSRTAYGATNGEQLFINSHDEADSDV